MHIIKVRKSLIKALEDEGYVVEVLTARDEYFDTLVAEGYKIHEINTLERQGTSVVEQVKLYLEYKTNYKKIRPDFVIHYTIKPNIYGTLVASSLHIPSIMTVNGLGQIYENQKLFKMVSVLYRRACNKSKAVIFQNADDQQIFISKKIVAKKKAFLVNGSGIDCQLFSPQICNGQAVQPMEGKLKFILITRLLWTKGVREYYEAAERIKKKYPQATFYIVGYTQDNERVGVTSSIMQEWQKTGIIQFLGSIPDIRKILCGCDVAVLPSYYREGIPRFLIEALALGKAIITTDNVGCRETVVDNWNGFMVPVKNVDHLYKAMEKMIVMTNEKLTEFKDNSRKFAIEKFDEKEILKVYTGLTDQYLTTHN
ncbi:MAG: glycosyltransferase family 4 protein [Chitinophagaceae bacterium]|nr:glycosyltransferase family 4 protein [Chitinophagaceae bacterium]